MTALDSQWAEEFCRLCDPVFEAAAVGFTRQVLHSDDEGATVSALLWEANPTRFAEKYPDSGVIESYGAEQWSEVTCIDYWVYLDHDKNQCRLSVEGWNLPELILNLSGYSSMDGFHIADVFARILGVRSPRL